MSARSFFGCGEKLFQLWKNILMSGFSYRIFFAMSVCVENHWSLAGGAFPESVEGSSKILTDIKASFFFLVLQKYSEIDEVLTIVLDRMISD